MYPNKEFLHDTSPRGKCHLRFFFARNSFTARMARHRRRSLTERSCGKDEHIQTAVSNERLTANAVFRLVGTRDSLALASACTVSSTTGRSSSSDDTSPAQDTTGLCLQRCLVRTYPKKRKTHQLYRFRFLYDWLQPEPVVHRGLRTPQGKNDPVVVSKNHSDLTTRRTMRTSSRSRRLITIE